MVISFREFTHGLKTLQRCYEEAIKENLTLDDTVSNVIKKNAESIFEAVVSADVAQTVLPLGELKRKYPSYKVTTQEALEFIEANKKAYKKVFGSQWEEILTCIASIKYNKGEQNL